jgi:hypothetical protein
MQKRHASTTQDQIAPFSHTVQLPRPDLTAAQIRRAAKVRHQLEALKEELAQVLGMPTENARNGR